MENVEGENGNNAKQSSIFQNTVCLEKMSISHSLKS